MPGASPKTHWAGNRYRKGLRHRLAAEKQQKQLPKTGGDPTSLFTLGAGVLLLAGGVLARNLAK